MAIFAPATACTTVFDPVTTSPAANTPGFVLSNGAAPKDVQELLGHSDVSNTMNIYAHSTRKAKRDSARLLDKVASNA